MVKINGEDLQAAGMTVAAYLASKSYDTRRIVVEKNGEIIPKQAYETELIQDEDVIEVVSFVGGG